MGVCLFRSNRAQTALLLIASYLFYMWWNPAFILLIVFSTTIDFTVGAAIARSDQAHHRRSLLIISLLSNLILLGTFKYLDFALSSLNQIISWAGAGLEFPLLRLMLPVGISFYTFQSMSYTIDIYRRKIEPEQSFLRFALFVAFFPQLVAGPILRASQFIPQLRRVIRLTSVNLNRGIDLFVIGLVKKVVVGDNLAPFVDTLLNDPIGHSSLEIWIGAMLFYIQLYCDFSGYTDMARGVGRMLGFQIPRNFNYPFLSRSMSEFWQRWHITLSSWLHDYLFVSLLDRRKGRRNLLTAVFITMFLCGLWHGASLNFVLFGIWIALVQCVEISFGWRTSVGREIRHGHRTLSAFSRERLGGWLRWAINLVVLLYAFLLFRVTGAENVIYTTRKFFLIDIPFASATSTHLTPDRFFEAGIVLFFLIAHLLSRRAGGIELLLERVRGPARIVVYAVVVYILLLLWPAGEQAYVYFQF